MSEKGKIKAPRISIKELSKLVLKSGDGKKATLASILRRGNGSWSAPWSATLLGYPTQGKEEPPKEIDYTDPTTGKKWVFIVPKNVDVEAIFACDIKDLEMRESPDGKTVTVSVKPK